ncbi:MAG: amino acid ABC transporter substrate-binding protein [Campylobacterales bacterium]|nr:amino acid ABC transporter substrate-binding protein [Campylobacterales bacterium]
MVRLILFLWCMSGMVYVAMSDVLEEMHAREQMRVCIWPEYYGISYLDPRTQTLQGIDVDLAKEFGRDLGVETVFVPSSFATLIEDVRSKRCDIAMFAIGHTNERKAHLLLTSPHLMSDMYAIVTKSNRRIRTWEDIDQEGVVVAVAKGTYHVAVMQEKLQKAKVLVVNSLHAREQEVEAGRADVLMTDFPFGKRMVAQREWARLIIPPAPFYLTPYGWAVGKEEVRLWQRAEEFIRTIQTDGRLESAAKRHQLDPIVVRKPLP